MPKNFKRFALSCSSVTIGAAVLFSLIPSASAAAVGILDEANCSGGGVTVNATTITWLPAGTVSGTGCIDTGMGTNLAYSGGTLVAGVVGNIKNLSPGGVVDSFMTFQGTTLDFVLTGFMTPVTTNGTNCASTTTGQTCVATATSPFLLTNLGGGDTGVALTAFGTITDGGVTSTWSGSFTTQLTVSPGSVESTIASGGSVTSTQSAQFTVSAVPEPASFTMIGAGLIAFALAAKKRMARR
jgi:hypothetical protein